MMALFLKAILILHVHPLYVIDGDTFVFDHTRVRLYGLNAPEKGMKCYEEAKRALEEYLRDDTSMVIIGRDRFGRELAILWNSKGSSLYYLFSRGLAIPYPYSAPPIALGALRTALESWRPGCLFRSGNGTVTIISLDYNPPGPDYGKEKVVVYAKRPTTITLLNKRWESTTAYVTVGTNTITFTKPFMGNKGDVVIIHINGAFQDGVAYVPKAFTVHLTHTQSSPGVSG